MKPLKRLDDEKKSDFESLQKDATCQPRDLFKNERKKIEVTNLKNPLMSFKTIILKD